MGGHIVKSAMLDADPRVADGDFALSLVCMDGLPIVRLIPYTYVVLPGIDSYSFIVWDDIAEEIVTSTDTLLTLLNSDGSAVVVPHRATVNTIVNYMLMSIDLRPGLLLAATMWDSSEEVPDLWAIYDASGVRDALHYLECFWASDG